MLEMKSRLKWLGAFAGSLVVLGLGVALNKLWDVRQDAILFPTSLLYKRFPPYVFGSDTYPTAVRMSILCLHLLIWTGILFGLARLFVSLQARRTRRA